MEAFPDSIGSATRAAWFYLELIWKMILVEKFKSSNNYLRIQEFFLPGKKS